jgi:hypothetical protein
MDLRTLGGAALTTALALAFSGTLLAHCDTMDGPVVASARTALDTGDLTPVLKWVPKASEPEVGAVFARTLKVRSIGAEAREVADLHFLETLVRLHRAGEGEPYTGLKPAGAAIDPAVAAADKALEKGSADALVRTITQAVVQEVRERFERVSQASKTAGQSVEAGRRYVAAYVDLMHYLEQLDGGGRRHAEIR